MSSSDNLFSAHNSSLYIQQNELNGDSLSTTNNRSNRATMESIKSVHENPFYKNFGIRHNAPSNPRQVNHSLAQDQIRHANLNGRASSVDDDIGEYRPGSGYVHKLLDKFSSLTAREEQTVNISHLKRSSSLDELPLDNETTADKPVIPRSMGIGYEKPSYLSNATLSHRARSIESLNHTHHKPHHSLAISLRHVETKWEKDKPFQRDSYNIAPDADLARDDIILIESTTSVTHLSDSYDDDDEAQKEMSDYEIILQGELPKPNTVLTVRNIFENASSGSGLYNRMQKLDSPLSPSSTIVKLALSPQQTSHVSANNQDGVSNRMNLHSPSNVTSPRIISDDHAKPNFLPSSYTPSKADHLRHTSDMYTRSEVPRSPISNNSSYIISSQQTDYVDDYPFTKSSVLSPDGSFERESSLEDAGSSDYLHLTTPSRSIPTVKSAVSERSGLPSVSTTAKYQKSGSVSSTTSLKDKIEDGKNDELPVMIFTKSNLSKKKDKPQRTKDYTGDVSREFKNDENDQGSDVINLKDVKKMFENDDSTNETGSKILSHRRFFNSNANAVDKNSSSDQSKIIYTKHHTTIEVKGNTKGALEKERLSVEGKLKHTETDDDLKLTKPVAFRRTNVTKSKTKAPEASVGSRSRSPDNSINNEELLSETHKEKTATSKRSYPSDAPALNEQPLIKVSKDKSDSKKEPVKGIPSIIARRLNKQYSDPSQVAEDVLSSSGPNEVPIDEDSNEGVMYSRRHLIPTSTKSSSSDNSEKDNLGSEIQNEIAAVRKKMEGSRSKSVGPSPIFDSSQLTKKRKDRKKEQTSTSQGPVPPLDLSGITDDQIMEYQPPPKNIAPCNIVFMGENAKTSRSLLTKQRKVKINIRFNDDEIAEMFEYLNEEVALDMYLQEHPHEKEEILVLDDFSGGADESSDDVEIDVFETPVTPRDDTDDELVKSKTTLASSGSLHSYRGRYQQDYELGTIILEQPDKAVEPESTVDPDKLMLRPAEEDDTNTWSTSSSSDILF